MGLKEAAGKINSMELCKYQKLPEELNLVLSFIYEVLYDDDNKKFDWTNFKKKGIQEDKGQDFQIRLAQLDLNMKPERLSLLQ